MDRWPFSWKDVKLLAMPSFIWGGRRAHPAPDFAALSRSLDKAQRQLEQTSEGLAAGFGDAAAGLGTLTKSGQRFVELVDRLVGLASGKDCDHSVFSSAIPLLEESTAFLAECGRQTHHVLDLLRSHNVEIRRLLGVESELQRTMLPLKFVQTLFKAESAPLGAGVQQMFIALTQEIEGLHNQVREIFGTKFKQLEQTHRTIGEVIRQLEKQARLLDEVTSVQKAEFNSSLTRLRHETAANQERDVRLGRLSRDLARDIQQMVAGLEVKDSVGQKFQLATAALPRVQATLAQLSNTSRPAGSVESLRFLQRSCRNEAVGLDEAQTKLAKAETALQGRLHKVLARLTEMDSHCFSLEEFKQLTTSCDGIVQVLVEMIEKVRETVDASVASAGAAFELLEPLGGLASDLTGVVRGMSAQIHLIGLNAQVQAALAAQDRRGNGLEVLAARTSEISEETNRISERAALALDGLAGGLAESVQAFEQLRQGGVAHQTVLNEQGRMEEQRLHALRDDALGTLRAIGDSLDALRGQTERALTTVDFARFYGVALPELREPILAIAGVAERLLLTGGKRAAAFERSRRLATARPIES